MDTHQRIEAVRRRLREMQIDERAAELAGPPCSSCLYLLSRETKWPKGQAAYCGHMAYTQRAFDPTTGAFVETNDTLASTARLTDGLCGAEAVLFEPLSTPHAALRAAKATALTVAGIGMGAGVIAMLIEVVRVI